MHERVFLIVILRVTLNYLTDGAGMSPHVMQYQQPPHFPMAGGQEVFVFSTRMANQAAQAIYTGQADSILSYHRSQTAHRDYLHPEQVSVTQCPWWP